MGFALLKWPRQRSNQRAEKAFQGQELFSLSLAAFLKSVEARRPPAEGIPPPSLLREVFVSPPAWLWAPSLRGKSISTSLGKAQREKKVLQDPAFKDPPWEERVRPPVKEGDRRNGLSGSLRYRKWEGKKSFSRLCSTLFSTNAQYECLGDFMPLVLSTAGS